jgi:hypothetical protein
MDWPGFWQLVLYGAIGVFSLMSVWVIVAGYGDIKRMFAELRSQRDSNPEGEG